MTTPDVLRILIADDHEGFRSELREALSHHADMQVVADVSNGRDAILCVRSLAPGCLDVALMDIEMPIMNGIDATAEIVAHHPRLAVIVLTVSTLDSDLFAGLESGAVGYLNKSLSPDNLVRTLRDFHRNGSLPMSRVMAGKALAQFQQRKQAAAGRAEQWTGASLTRREREILRRIARGAHDREIAAGLVVAETTIKTHVRHILRKLGARNRAEAVAHVDPDVRPDQSS
jgi:DNA-binding NarL/FixJ family response regulator